MKKFAYSILFSALLLLQGCINIDSVYKRCICEKEDAANTITITYGEENEDEI